LFDRTTLARRPYSTNLSTGIPQFLWKIPEKNGKVFSRLFFIILMEIVEVNKDFQENPACNTFPDRETTGESHILSTGNPAYPEGMGTRLASPKKTGNFPLPVTG
jgi:hypothetical protein